MTAERQTIYPELPDDPRGMMVTRQLERALAEYAHQYVQSEKEGDLYIAGTCFEAMYQAVLSLSEEPLQRGLRRHLASGLRDAIAEASEGSYDERHFETNLKVCEEKYRPKRQRRRKLEG
ncbi:hypothetical protein M1O47_02230 [Dehalococcoidia bacterium]|nr:hypothetical protein [Dehalococcoidia bacterium]MCL0058492.1 hypothetical protein [Dehalococcoidia bacterium]